MRVSSLPLFARCPASAKMPDRLASNKFALMGTIFHKIMAYKLRMNPDNTRINEEIETIGLRYALSSDEIEDLRAGVYSVEFDIKKDVELHIEEQMEDRGGILTGSPDLFYLLDDSAYIVDYKSGWMEVDNPKTNLQLVGYACLVYEKYPHIREIQVYIVQPKLGQVKGHIFTSDEIIRAKESIEKIVSECSKPDPPRITGEHCGWCSPMQCPAYTREIQVFAGQLDKADKEKSIELNLKTLLPFVKGLSKVCKQVEDIAKMYVRENGPLKLGNGLFYVKTNESRRSIDVGKAILYLREVFGLDINEALKINVTDLRKLAVKTKRGLYKEVMEELSRLGSIREKQIEKFKIVPVEDDR